MVNPGLIPDPRPQDQKNKDYQHEEVAMSVPLNWNRDISGAPIYSLKDQNGGGYCVGEGSSKGLETLRSEVISAHPIYSRRKNAPEIGMWLQDAGDIIHKLGTTTEILDPSQKLTEAQISLPVTVPTPINKYLYVFVDVKDIDAIATAIETQKHCLITINGNLEEYASSQKPVVIPNSPLNCAHCICGVYYFTDNGVKCILIDESWGPNNIKRRILTEDYLRARGTGAMYFIPPAPIPQPEKPHFVFTVPLLFGDSSYGVKELQSILRYESLFPENVPLTGYYGAITAKGVLAWQLKHEVDAPDILNSLGGKRVGNKTIAALNKIYGN